MGAAFALENHFVEGMGKRFAVGIGTGSVGARTNSRLR